MRCSSFGANHLFVAITLARIGKFHKEKTKNTQKALKLFTEALAIYQANQLQVNHPMVMDVIKNIESLRNPADNSS